MKPEERSGARAGAFRQPLAERQFWSGEEREEGELVHDPFIEGRRIEEDEKRLLREAVEASERGRRAREHLGRENVRGPFVEDPAQRTRQVAVSGDVIDAPDRSVLVEIARVVGLSLSS